MLRKNLCILLCALFLSLAFGACAPQSETPPKQEEPSSSQPASASQPTAYPCKIKKEQALFKAEPLPEETRRKITGVSWVENEHISLDDLSLLTIAYCGFDGEYYLGQMIAANEVAQDLTEIFKELFAEAFPIEKIQLIEAYGADDNLSMADNNSSAFCYRVIDGTDYLSNHSFGRAVDINPLQNPYVRGELVQPDASADYLDRENVRPGMIAPGGCCYNAFISRGWEWGGDWTGPIDYQHFEKPQE
ncbi:MAG: M15 family metallopeptidase [Provencibacterium sp.]|jgi:hypothetical protein|nr:M15 family metallopeptidase [Provencibacterium sp.]